jgi:hypothetical protein
MRSLAYQVPIRDGWGVIHTTCGSLKFPRTLPKPKLRLLSYFQREVNSFMNASERSLASRLIALTAISVSAGCGSGKSGGSFAPPVPAAVRSIR